VGIFRKFNPLTNLVLFIGLSVVTFFSRSPWPPVAVLVGLTGATAAMRPRTGAMKWPLFSFLIGAPVTLCIFVLSYWAEEGRLAVGLPLGLKEGGLFLSRIGALIMANVLFVRLTDLRSLIASLRALGLPLGVAFLLTAALRFLPLAFEEARRVVEVQRCRGLRRNRILWPPNMLPLIVPLIVINAQRAHEMALTLQMRGIGDRGKFRPILRPMDWMAMATAVAGAILAFGGVI